MAESFEGLNPNQIRSKFAATGKTGQVLGPQDFDKGVYIMALRDDKRSVAMKIWHLASRLLMHKLNLPPERVREFLQGPGGEKLYSSIEAINDADLKALIEGDGVPEEDVDDYTEDVEEEGDFEDDLEDDK